MGKNIFTSSMVVMKKYFLCAAVHALFFAFCFPHTAAASETGGESVEKLFEISFEELLGQTVVTAIKAPQRLRETPATVRIVPAEQIRERGYLTLQDLLSDLPGVQFRDIQGFNSYVFMRGAPSQNNLILLLVDGIEMNELNSGGFYGGGQFNLANIKRVEVVYGPASTLYGTNAVSGVINIITRDPEDADAQGLWATAAAGSFDTLTADFRTAFYDHDKRFGYSLSGMYKTTEKADLAGSDGDNNWTGAMDNFEDDFSFDGKLKFRDVTFGFVYQDKKASRTTNYKAVDSDKLDFGTGWHITFMNLWLKHRYDIKEDWQLNSTVFYRDTTVQDDTIAFIDKAQGLESGRQAGYYRPNTQIGVEEQLNWVLGDRLDIIGGIAWKEEELAKAFSTSFSVSQDQTPSKPAKPDQLSEQLFSLFLMTQFKFTETLEFTMGLRWDDSSAYGSVTTPRFGLVYNRDRFVAKLLYSEAFRAPKPWDYTSGSGNPGLSPEEMDSFEGTLGYQFSSHIRGEISVYRNDITDLLIFDPTADCWENLGGLETEGVEVTVDYTMKKLNAYLNYTYTDSEGDAGAEEPEIARHGANIGMTYAFTDRLKLNLRGNYLGKRKTRQTIPATGTDEIEDAFVAHGNLAWSGIGNMDVNLSVRNLAGTAYYHSSNRPPARYRQPQRTVMFKVRYRF